MRTEMIFKKTQKMPLEEGYVWGISILSLYCYVAFSKFLINKSVSYSQFSMI